MDSNSINVVSIASAQVATPIAAQVLVMHIVVSISISPGEKPEKFNKLNFKRYQYKMLFYLITLNLARFLTKKPPKLKEYERDIQVIGVVDTLKHFDFLCKNYVMNSLLILYTMCIQIKKNNQGAMEITRPKI